jgi:abequosyltransferase
MSNQIFLLSICIPTFNRSTSLFKVLSSITRQEEFLRGSVQICISNNASTDDTEAVAKSAVNQFPNLVKYTRQETNISGDNFKAVLGMADGEYLKLNNDTLEHEEGSLSYLLDEIKCNKEKYPMFFSKDINVTAEGLDQFVRAISYNATYIGGLGLWRKDLSEVLGISQVTEQLWQVEVIFHLVSKNKQTEIRPLNHMTITNLESKGGYPFNKVFLDSYLKLLHSALTARTISHSTYLAERKRVLLRFCANWAGKSIAGEGSHFKVSDHFNYVLKWYKDNPFVLVAYLISVFLYSVKYFIKKSIKYFKFRGHVS